MLFHVEVIPRENWGPLEAPAIQKSFIEQIDVIMKSGKVKASGLYADERGGFFTIDVNTPEELLILLAPILDGISVNAHPIVPIDILPKLLERVAK